MTGTDARNSFTKAEAIFRQHGGLLRTMEAIRLGVHPEVLYGMRDAGVLELVRRGLFRLVDSPPIGNPDLCLAAKKIPKGVICLVSALSFHDITTQIAHEVYIALEFGSRTPSLDRPPVRVFRFKGPAFDQGIEVREIDRIPVRIYSPEKTLADCFKHRNKIGLDVAIEALKLYKARKPVRVDLILRYARICRVEKIIRPYLEGIL